MQMLVQFFDQDAIKIPPPLLWGMEKAQQLHSDTKSLEFHIHAKQGMEWRYLFVETFLLLK